MIGDWHSMFLPVLTLTLITVATFSRYMRSSSIDVLAQDYIKVARAKGLPERLVLLAAPGAERVPADDHPGRACPCPPCWPGT